MPDITMCTDKGCPKRMACYRYRAVPDKKRQSYFATTPCRGQRCEMYDAVRDWQTLRPLEECDKQP